MKKRKVILILSIQLSILNVFSCGKVATKIKSEGFVKVKGGTFEMGSNYGDSNEKPPHSITVDSFYIGKYEVTEKEYHSVMGTNPSEFKGENLPIDLVSWEEAIEFCNKYNKLKGLPEAYDSNGNIVNWKSYRLPTEAEWEYAAKGGNKSQGYQYSGGNNLSGIANFCDVNCDYDWKDNSINDGYKDTSPVGSFRPNELGIYDMSGNVSEWCSDLYDEMYYRNDFTIINPYNNKLGFTRVMRDRGCHGSAYYLRVSTRDSSIAAGIRLVKPTN